MLDYLDALNVLMKEAGRDFIQSEEEESNVVIVIHIGMM